MWKNYVYQCSLVIPRNFTHWCISHTIYHSIQKWWNSGRKHLQEGQRFHKNELMKIYSSIEFLQKGTVHELMMMKPMNMHTRESANTVVTNLCGSRGNEWLRICTKQMSFPQKTGHGCTCTLEKVTNWKTEANVCSSIVNITLPGHWWPTEAFYVTLQMVTINWELRHEDHLRWVHVWVYSQYWRAVSHHSIA